MFDDFYRKRLCQHSGFFPRQKSNLVERQVEVEAHKVVIPEANLWRRPRQNRLHLPLQACARFLADAGLQTGC